MSKKIKLALISPVQNAYSETFIQAHKKHLDADICYYFGGRRPLYLEGKYSLVSLKSRIINKLQEKIFRRFKTSLEYALHSSFKKERIQVALAEYGPTGTAILQVCKKLNIPLIVHFHGYDASRYSEIEANDNYKELFSYAQKVVVVSQTMKDDLIKMGCDDHKIVLNPCAPDDSFNKLNPSFESLTFVGVGRFVDKKAPYYTLLAFARVVKEVPEAKLILAGDGPLLNTCQNLARTLEIEGQVSFPGVIKPEVFKEYLSNARAYVQHSITAADGDKEGTPVAVLEASSAGIPVISTRHAGIPDVILNEKTGLLVDEHDIEAMAEAMLQLLIDMKQAKELGQNGKVFIRENFNMEKHIAILNGLIEEVVKVG